jgi:hypothetical protein
MKIERIMHRLESDTTHTRDLLELINVDFLMILLIGVYLK